MKGNRITFQKVLALNLMAFALLLISGCNGSEEASTSKSRAFSFLEMSNINSINSTDYLIHGQNCDPEQGEVLVSVGEPEVSISLPCDENGKFSGSLDVSSVTSNPPIIVASQGEQIAEVKELVNDQAGPDVAPLATKPSEVVSGERHNLFIKCNEPGEVISVSGSGLDPSQQMYECVGAGLEEFSLSLKTDVSHPSPNILSLTSKDQYGNPARATSEVDFPMDNVVPSLSITNQGEIQEGQSAVFTITLSDDHMEKFDYTPLISSGTLSPSSCTTNPCELRVSDAEVGELSLQIEAESIADGVGNKGPAASQKSVLNVKENASPIITDLSVESGADSWYKSKDTVSLAVTYSEPVNVSLGVSGDKPSIPVTVGNGTKPAQYTSGSGTKKLLFNFTVANGDNQCNGKLMLGSLSLNGGSIKDVYGKNADHSNLADSISGVNIDTSVPTFAGVSVNSDDARSNKAATALVSEPKDNCSATKSYEVQMSIGQHDGAACAKPQAITDFLKVSLSAQNSYQPTSGVAPFSNNGAFELDYQTKYCTSVRLKDAAGNFSEIRSSSSWFYGSNDLPAQYSSMKLWLDAMDINGDSSAISEGDSVSTWTDKSGNSNHGSSTGTPLLDKTAFDGLPAVDFTPTNTYMDGSSSMDAKSIYIVYRPTVNYEKSGERGVVFRLDSVQESIALGPITGYLTDEVVTFLRDGYNRDAISSNKIPLISKETGHIVSVTTNKDEAYISSDGSGDLRDLSTGNNINISGIWNLGGTAYQYKGLVAEVLVYNEKHNESEVQDIEGYLACKWNLRNLLPETHPYYSIEAKDNLGCE